MTETPQDPDRELVDRAREAPEGDLRAFEAIVQRHQPKVIANCRYLTRSEADAEDLAQEVFIKAFFGLRRFEGRSTFRTWLQRIKVNQCLNHLKKGAGKTFVDLDVAGEEGANDLSVEPQAQKARERADDRERIDRVLDSMSDTLRIPLIMRDLDGLPYEEIASALGIGLSAVKMRIKRAREEFQRRYGPRSAARSPEKIDA